LKNLICLETPSLPTVTILGPSVEGGDAASIARCTTTGFRPADINITWTIEGGPTNTSLHELVNETGNGTFMVSSDYRRAVNRTFNGKTLTCTVSHVSLTLPMSTSVLLTVLCTCIFCYTIIYLFIYLFMSRYESFTPCICGNQKDMTKHGF